MNLHELTFECGDDSLSLRRFSVREAMSSLFEVSLWARSPDADLDLAAFVGRGASFRIAGAVGAAGARVWSGVCSFMEQEQAEPSGLSTYHLRLTPTLWLLGHRQNHRIFQRRSVPEIVGSLLGEWGIGPVWRLDQGRYPKLDYRVQHGESDLAFVERLLEEAGISFFFSDAGQSGSELVFCDAPQAAEPRAGGPIAYADHPNPALEQELVTQVKVAQEVRTGRVALRDFDFRRKPDYQLFGRAAAAAPAEARLERYRYEPGAFVVLGGKGGDTLVADDKGVARAEEQEGNARAERQLAGERASRQTVAFQTNALDLAPGVVFSMARHPRANLGADQRLLVIELSIDGTQEGKRMAVGRSVFARLPYGPASKTPKPRVQGVESAVVVGPEGQEIHTDEFGRVRVQFHWDREGGFDDGSSCWMRVSQGWAGGGYGTMAIPRVGQEVLVGFFDGDPDQPVVVGRVYNGSAPVPYKLPEHRTRSTWKSSSSPGSDGFNELMFEDAKGHELVYVQAERNLEKLVKVDETITVGKRRATTVGEIDEAAIGVKEAVHIKGTPTGREMVAGRISFTTGEATITLEGPNISMQAAANIMLSAGASILASAGANVVIHGAANITVASGATAVVKAGGGDLVLEGGPMVKINTGGGGAEAVRRPQMLSFGDVRVVVPPETDIEKNLAMAKEHQHGEPGFLMEKLGDGGEWDFNKLGPRYEAFHLFHLGMVGRAMGLPKGALMRFARRRYTRPEAGMDYVGPVTAAGGARFDGEPERPMLVKSESLASKSGGWA